MSHSFVTPWTVARQAPLFRGFPRQECWSGLSFPSPEDLPNPGIKPMILPLQADSLPLINLGSLLYLHLYDLRIFYNLCIQSSENSNRKSSRRSYGGRGWHLGFSEWMENEGRNPREEIVTEGEIIKAAFNRHLNPYFTPNLYMHEDEFKEKCHNCKAENWAENSPSFK